VFPVVLIVSVLRSAPSWFRRALAVAVTLLLLSGSSGAAGTPAAEVDAIIKKAVDLRHQGKDQEALTELRRAAEIANPPRLSVQTGFAEQALGLWAPAEKHLQEGLAQASDPWIAKNRATIEKSLTFVGEHLATLDVWGSPDGAEIFVNGESMGTLPLTSSLRVAAGTTQLSVRAKGFTPALRTLELAAGANERERVVLLAQEVSPPGEAASPAAAPGPVVSLSSQPEPVEAHPAITSRWWFWTLAGVVVAGGVTAIVLATHKSGDSCAAGATCSQW
jgi:hypothetical protein